MAETRRIEHLSETNRSKKRGVESLGVTNSRFSPSDGQTRNVTWCEVSVGLDILSRHVRTEIAGTNLRFK